MDVTFRQIKSFLAVARCGSFTQAARMLSLSQPALTIQIKQLEASLGLKLFDRSTHHVRLTRAGTSFVPIIQKVIGDFEEAITSARRVLGKQQEVIRLACFPSFAATVLPRAIALFRAANPDVSFIVRDVAARAVVAMIRSEEVDCGICDDDPSATDLECRPLIVDQMLVVLPRDHPLAKLKRVTLASVVEYPLVLLNADSNARQLIDAAFASGGHFVVPAGEAAYMSTAVAMVEAGLGLTILPQLAINLKAHPDLIVRSVEDAPFIRTISAITKKNMSISPTARDFINLLASVSAEYTSDTGSDSPES